MFDDHGRPVKSAGPSTPVEVLGLQGAPEAGDQFQVADEARARHIVEFRQGKLREASLARSAGARITLDQLHEQLRAGEVKELPLVIKADVQGSVEVLSEMLPKLSDDRVKLKIIHASIGAVTENDVLLASASGAIVVAFNVRPDRKASDLAQREGVEIRPHSMIYEVSDEIKKAMTGLLEPVFKETHLGRAEVRDTFRVKGVGMIAGCYVLDGILKRDADVRVLRDGVVVYTGKISSLRRFKDDVNEVRSGFECGASVSNFNDIKVGIFSSASTCRSSCWRKRLPDFFARLRDRGMSCTCVRRDEDADRSAHPGNLYPRGALAQRQAAGAPQPEGQAAGEIQCGRGGTGRAGFLAALGGGRREPRQQRRISRTILAHCARGIRTAPGPRSGRPRIGSPVAKFADSKALELLIFQYPVRRQ